MAERHLNWDGTHYLRLAAHGYRAAEHDGFRFVPLFPIAVSALHSLGLGLVAAGILLNAAAGGVAAVVLYLLAIDYCHDRARAERAFLLFLLFPSSYFLAAYYTEALFCALGFAAFLLARRRQWLAAGVLLGLMTATRPTAFCFASAIFAEYLSWKRFSWRAIDRQILTFALAPLGLLAHMIYLHFRWGDALLFLHTQLLFPRIHFSPNLIRPLWSMATYAAIAGHYGLWVEATYAWTALGCTMAAAIVLIPTARRMPLSYTVLLGASLLVLLSSGTLESSNRYVLPLFPLYLILADELSTFRYRAWLTASAALMTFLLCAFVANITFTG
jgi:Mannosyltransferase (PIG-V)